MLLGRYGPLRAKDHRWVGILASRLQPQFHLNSQRQAGTTHSNRYPMDRPPSTTCLTFTLETDRNGMAGTTGLEEAISCKPNHFFWLTFRFSPNPLPSLCPPPPLFIWIQPLSIRGLPFVDVFNLPASLFSVSLLQVKGWVLVGLLSYHPYQSLNNLRSTSFYSHRSASFRPHKAYFNASSPCVRQGNVSMRRHYIACFTEDGHV